MVKDEVQGDVLPLLEGLLIGELSRRVGISTQTIRYYERLGLLNPPQRTKSQYRLYSEVAEERLRFIQKAKNFGLSLEEIKKLIEIRAEGIAPCSSLKSMLQLHINELDTHIQQLTKLRQELAQKYAKINSLIPDELTIANEEICQGKICGFIEQENVY